jgi:hypothetical protein
MFGALDDDINEDDYRRYMGIQARKGKGKEEEDEGEGEGEGEGEEEGVKTNAGPKKKRVSFNNDDDDDPKPKPRPKPKPKRPVLLEEEDDAITTHSHRKSFLDGMDVSVPITRASSSLTKVPFRVQQAAERILESDTMHRADKRVLQHLSMVASSPNELCVVDPHVWMRGFVDTGTCRVCLCEALPISEYLLARALRLSFSVQITPKAKTPPLEYEEAAASDIVLKPWTGDKPTASHAQPYGCSEQVRARMESAHPKLVQQVEVYMYALGPLSPALVVELEWVEAQLEAMKKILSGELVPMRPKKKQ